MAAAAMCRGRAKTHDFSLKIYDFEVGVGLVSLGDTKEVGVGLSSEDTWMQGPLRMHTFSDPI